MHQHFRRYCFRLADRLKMSVQELLNTLNSAEIAEWMAYDVTCSEEWVENYNKELELEMSRNMSDDEKLQAFKTLLGV